MNSTKTHETNPEALYLLEGGECQCGGCLGHTAATTGKDIHGNPIAEVTESALLEMPELYDLQCDKCGKEIDG